jgi:hypothetical protein
MFCFSCSYLAFTYLDYKYQVLTLPDVSLIGHEIFAKFENFFSRNQLILRHSINIIVFVRQNKILIFFLISAISLENIPEIY